MLTSCCWPIQLRVLSDNTCDVENFERHAKKEVINALDPVISAVFFIVLKSVQCDIALNIFFHIEKMPKTNP